ncbi:MULTISPECIES: cytochrome c oxidase subunit 3 [Pseudoalteromonas]|uniref:cytochrome-c oxidase n=1 Tax=Pseudoalteromonas ruthenica TaxID=151081 RepID=A0A0F4Q4Z6_9GAMM|nr:MULTISPECIES: cytochrome c oxidase subunit 3 [Pseudoalteromonas]KJY97585.1 MFS transporter [Pseudoalteromonas ruthenica]KJZ01612.1 MFS transporter [Pseudoalteromonas ruthenica]MCF2862494.1 cytochrome c oxidase subunit 3 [Pseudoalteromonas sp. CNAT2-18]MCG7544710.1 cytochrome c oxidase subunit 3 [Pseudoalteromonas sp. MM17-2]MCG7559054.1 cytochrome c oxidase subunit 3 [Pseudoalteromonas sp. CNAT2-18.1]|tara:strand:- start:149284 stop:150159 length:876 start_codon:yes stop_codon:yes gene_type:complete
MSNQYEKYYVPEQSPWPIVGAVALFFIAVGAGLSVMQLEQGGGSGTYWLIAGIAVLVYMLVGWFRNVINESQSGLYSAQMDRSFKQGMSWFIFSEVMFFGAFFGALFYARMLAVPWLGGEGNNLMTNEVLWPEFSASWPLELTPGGDTTQAMGWQGLPLINTIILLVSSVTLQFAHTAIEKDNRKQLTVFLALTVILGAVFLFLQGEEYIHAYQDLGLKLDSGIYGNTFFLLTGFHGMHVTLGAIMLTVVLIRVIKGHFSSEKHFAFQAAAWYWHFVDVVWLCLFVFVYVL